MSFPKRSACDCPSVVPRNKASNCGCCRYTTFYKLALVKTDSPPRDLSQWAFRCWLAPLAVAQIAVWFLGNIMHFLGDDIVSGYNHVLVHQQINELIALFLVAADPSVMEDA